MKCTSQRETLAYLLILDINTNNILININKIEKEGVGGCEMRLRTNLTFTSFW